MLRFAAAWPRDWWEAEVQRLGVGWESAGSRLMYLDITSSPVKPCPCTCPGHGLLIHRTKTKVRSLAVSQWAYVCLERHFLPALARLNSYLGFAR